MKTVFITGAEGFTGRRLVEALRKSGHDVVGGVRNRARKLAFEKQFSKAVVCDVSDAINVARAIASIKPDAVVHLAGTALPHVAGEEPLIAYQSIVSAWANVLDGVRRAVPRARVLLASACEAYGNSGDDGRLMNESTPLKPVSTFGSMKATAESIARTYFENYHLNITIARPFHYTGAGQSELFFYANLARRIADWDPSGEGPTLRLPDLDCRRDVLHAQDVVHAYQRLLDDGKPNEVYNICSGQSVTVRQIAETLAKAAGKNLSFGSLDSDQDGHIASLCGDNTKLRNELGWNPVRTFDAALTELMTSLTPERASAAA